MFLTKTPSSELDYTAKIYFFVSNIRNKIKGSACLKLISMTKLHLLFNNALQDLQNLLYSVLLCYYGNYLK